MIESEFNRKILNKSFKLLINQINKSFIYLFVSKYFSLVDLINLAFVVILGSWDIFNLNAEKTRRIFIQIL